MKKGFTLIELMIVIAIIAIIAAIAIPGLLAAQRASNERNASASLKTITTAQADFRSNDRDGNLVNDFWTGDVFGLYGIIPIAGGANVVPADNANAPGIIKLIEPSVAAADGQGQSNGAVYGNITIAASIVQWSPKAGYLYRSIQGLCEDGLARTDIAVDTDGAGIYYGDDTHDRNRFAFMAFPDTLSSGKLMYIVSMDNTIYKMNLPQDYTCTYNSAGADANTAIGGTYTGEAAATFEISVAAGLNQGTFPQAPGAVGFSKMD